MAAALVRGKLQWLLRGLWRQRLARFTLGIALLAFLLRQPVLLVIPLVGAFFVLLQRAYIRILDSVRAKLMAFYLYAALLPILLVACILLFFGYVVLGHTSAQVVERRLEGLAAWMERQGAAAETQYWRGRAAGSVPWAAAPAALAAALAGADTVGLVWWVSTPRGEVVAAHGDFARCMPFAPAWLEGRSYAGIVARSGQLELRLHRPLADPAAELWLGAVLPLTGEMLARGLSERGADVRGGLGAPGRQLGPQALADSAAEKSGILAWIEPRRAPEDTSSAAVADVQRRLRAAVEARSRFPGLSWDYRGHPVDWTNGRTEASAPPLFIAFSIEGATQALVHTSFAAIEATSLVVLVVCSVIVLLQIVATARGFAYARAIAAAVARLDRGVRALRSGDFSMRIQPRERDQLGRLTLAFNDMAQQLQALLQARAEHESVERELAIARTVQQRLFPEHVPVVPYVEASGICLPARTVSGDYYDFIAVPGGFDAVIADVSGKGFSAALLMASLHAALRSQYPTEGGTPPEPAAILSRLNQHLHEHLEPTRFVTLQLVRFAADGTMLYASAGHNPAALLRGNRVEWLQEGGLLLGPFDSAHYESTQVQLHDGDVLCLYTDGVTEAVGAAGEHFGEERLAAALRSGRHLAPQALQEAIVAQVRAWQGEDEPSDDLTLVVLRVKRSAA